MTVEGFSYAYSKSSASSEKPPWALQHLTFSIAAGECVAVMGAPGAGKSTLCCAMNGIVPRSTGGVVAGSVRVDGFNTQEHAVPFFSERVGMVFEDADSSLFNQTLTPIPPFG